MPVTIDGSSGITSPAIDLTTTPLAVADGGTGLTAGENMFRNRIINGSMMIDQRNAGASVTPTATTYTLDRWQAYNGGVASKYSVQRNAGSVTPPAGFINYLGVTSTSAYSVGASERFGINQTIEGLNASDLGWGTANAATVTLSFWVRSSLTGAFGGSIQNYAATRSYPYSFTISSANTWEYKTITIQGDTSGTWVTTNDGFATLNFSLGTGTDRLGTAGAWASSDFRAPTGSTSVVGTNGATFYITGVQLEKGSTATSFDYRPYGTELQLCQRYYYRFNPSGAGSNTLGVGFADSTTSAQITHFYPVPMRTNPTALEQSGTAGNYAIRYTGAGVATCNSVPTYSDANVTNATFNLIVASGLTGGQAVAGRAVNTSAWLAWSAEL